MLLSRYQSRGLLFRVLAFLMMLLILVMPIMVPMAEAAFAEALVASYAYELIAGILVSGGAVFSTQSDLIKASELTFLAMQNGGSPFVSTLLGLAAGALTLGDDITGKAIRVSADLWQSICDAFSSVFSPTDTGFVTGRWTSVTGSSADDFVDFCASIDWDATALSLPIHSFRVNGDTYTVAPDGSKQGQFNFYKNGSKITDAYWGESIVDLSLRIAVFNISGDKVLDVQSISIHSDGSLGASSWYFDKGVFQIGKAYSYPMTIEVPDGYISVSGDLTYTGDQTLVLAPPLPTTTADPDTGKEIVVVPPISVKPGDWTADFPKTGTGENVDVPTDTLVDATTGTKVDVGDIPVTPPIALPTIPDMTMPGGIADKFPFSLPFDVYRIFAALVVDPVAPDISFPLKIDGVVDTTVKLDITQFSSLFEVLKWGEYVVFCIGLAYATSKIIKW